MSRAVGHGRGTAGDGDLGGGVHGGGGHLLARGSDGRGGSAGAHLARAVGDLGTAGGDGHNVGGVFGVLQSRDSRNGAREDGSGDKRVTHFEIGERFPKKGSLKEVFCWLN